MMDRLTARSRRRAVRGVAAVVAGVGLLAEAVLAGPGRVRLPVGLRAAPAAGLVWEENLQVDKPLAGAELFLTDPALRPTLTGARTGWPRLRKPSPSAGRWPLDGLTSFRMTLTSRWPFLRG